MSAVLVVPVKRLTLAKTRLDGDLAPHREALALAFAMDTVAAALLVPEVRVLAVSDDERVTVALLRLGAQVIADEPDAGLNAALRHGAAVAATRFPGMVLGALSADLPALRSTDLSAALTVMGSQAPAFVADHAGTGTTLLTAADPSTFSPRFGPGSAHLHRESGAVEIMIDCPTLRCDVDTPQDLVVARQFGLGSYTQAVVQSLGTVPDGA